MIPPANYDLARAFAKQAMADFDARHALCGHAEVPECQRLHFLQMACEKLCKAHLLIAGSNPKDIESSHAYVAKPLPTIIRGLLSNDDSISKSHRSVLLGGVPGFAREIELLAPAVDDAGRRKDNCEYPWVDNSGTIRVPAEHDFANLRFLERDFGRVFLKLLRQAIQVLAQQD